MLRKLRKPSFGGDGQQVRVSESQAETRQAMYGVSLSPVTDGRGKEKGRIKKPDYFRFLLEWRDRETMQCVPLQNRASLLEIRSEYEKMYGSIYLTP